MKISGPQCARGLVCHRSHPALGLVLAPQLLPVPVQVLVLVLALALWKPRLFRWSRLRSKAPNARSPHCTMPMRQRKRQASLRSRKRGWMGHCRQRPPSSISCLLAAVLTHVPSGGCRCTKPLQAALATWMLL